MNAFGVRPTRRMVKLTDSFRSLTGSVVLPLCNVSVVQNLSETWDMPVSQIFGCGHDRVYNCALYSRSLH